MEVPTIFQNEIPLRICRQVWRNCPQSRPRTSPWPLLVGIWRALGITPDVALYESDTSHLPRFGHTTPFSRAFSGFRQHTDTPAKSHPAPALLLPARFRHLHLGLAWLCGPYVPPQLLRLCNDARGPGRTRKPDRRIPEDPCR